MSKLDDLTRADLDGKRVTAVANHQRLYPWTGTGATFEEILCHNLHTCDGETYGGWDFEEIAHRFCIPLRILGLMIADHCALLDHEYPVRYMAWYEKED
jgi:hypothetical protein